MKDNSGICTIRFLYNETIEDILSIKDYVKVFANVKCVMVNYQYQIGIVGVTVVKVEYFDQLTCHLLECLRS